MKKILGLDLGSSSIGWAVVEENSAEVTDGASVVKKTPDKILALGSRIVPIDSNVSTAFSKGQAITINSYRTQKRTIRKGYDRYQQRRTLLFNYLQHLGMFSGDKIRLPKLELWGLRAKAVDNQVSLPELGRVLCHINQKRGYKTAKADFNDDAPKKDKDTKQKQSEYLQKISQRYDDIHTQHYTIGQYLYNQLLQDDSFRCKEKIFPRKAYMEEYDAIMHCQQQFYPEVLTDEVVLHIRDYIIFYQRPLKSCKHLVSKCELESRNVEKDGKIKKCGPMVAPRSSPLFQVCKIWESINNLRISNAYNTPLELSLDQKKNIFDFLNTHDKMKIKDLQSSIAVKSEEWNYKEAIGGGLQGNTTYTAISKILANDKSVNIEELLRFDLQVVNSSNVNTKTGEVVKVIDGVVEQQPFYQLWHALYSIDDVDVLRRVLKNKFKISNEESLKKLCKLDFTTAGYGNKSTRAMRKILPYLMEGKNLYEAEQSAGYADRVLTKEANEARTLAKKLLPIPKGDLRQPVVEKVLNQMVNLVNKLMEEYGNFDEIRVELARELKQSREERESATDSMKINNSRNKQAAERIREYGLPATKTRIQRYRLWTESGHQCIYCGRFISEADLLNEENKMEREHIIPRSVLFDDSFSNKVCSCRECNQSKGNLTAYDFMKDKPGFKDYIDRVNKLSDQYKKKGNVDYGFSKTKKRNLLMKKENLPTDFISRQLNETQYIAKKATEMLKEVCYDVHSTSGNITDFIKHVWGWDNVLHDLNLSSYRNAGLTSMVSMEKGNEQQEIERITDWSKRLDHRHHAVDAIVIACTKQGYIQRINNLNSLKELSFASFNDDKQDSKTKHRLSALERYIQMQPHFTTAEIKNAVDGIAVSFKSGKRAASVGKRYIYKNGKRILAQTGIIIPRGALSEEYIYGKINGGKAVKKYFVEKITAKNIDKVVDRVIREKLKERLAEYNGDENKAFAVPVFDHQNRAIRSVRCYTNGNPVPVRYNKKGEPIAFVETSNNHHVAIYEDENHELHEHIVTFWHAVERKKYGFPVIIENPNDVADKTDSEFIKQLPSTWKLKFYMQQNDMFIVNMSEEEYQKAMQEQDNTALCKHLYRVQKLSSMSYWFRKHTETKIDDKYLNEKGELNYDFMKSYKRGVLILVQSLKALDKLNLHKVRVDITGKIKAI